MVTAYSDDSLTDVLAMMNRVAKELGGPDGKRFRKYTDRFREYEKHRAELEADPNAPDSTAVFLTRAAVKVGLGALQSVPVVGAVSGAVDANALTDQLVHWTTYVGRKFGNKETTDLVTKPVETLTPYFVESLLEVPEETEIALFFDTYERTSDFLDAWLRDLLQGTYGGLPYNVVFVIAGQLRLDPNAWSSFGDVIQDLPLEPFTIEEITGFLAKKGITERAVVAEIAQLSNGLPLLVATLAENSPASTQARGATGTAVERFLKWEPDPARRQAAKDAALPRVVNVDVLATLVAPDKAAETMEWLRRMPFVSEHPNGYQYHQVVRSAMLRLKRRESQIGWTATHDRLADAAAARRSDLHGSEANWASEQWRRHVHDEVYHRLCARPQLYLGTALEMVVDVLDATDLRPWGAVFARAGQDLDDPSLVRWGELLNEGAEPEGWGRLLDELEAVPALPPVTRARIHAFRALYRFDVDPADEGAFDELDRAVQMAPDDPMVIGVRGLANRSRGRYEQALADFDRALQLRPDYWLRLTSRGETYRLMGDFAAAVRDFTLALERGERDSWTYNARGLAHFDDGRLELALPDFEKARELSPEDPGPPALIAFTRMRLGENDVAVSMMDDLVDRFPDQAWLLVNRSTVYSAASRVDDALADLDRAVELEPGDIAARQLRGGLLFEALRYADAIEAYTAILARDPGREDRYLALANRGLARSESGALDDAFDDLSAALDLYPDDLLVRRARARVSNELARYDEALADIEQVVAAESDSEIRVMRALALQGAEREDEAVAAFTEALDMDLDVDNRIVSLMNRGLTYVDLEEYELALADFTAGRAILPDDQRILGLQVDVLSVLGRHDEALEINAQRLEMPGDHHVRAHLQRAEVLRAADRFAEAAEEDRAAYELDPLVLDTVLDDVRSLGYRGRHADAVEYLTRMLAWTGPHYDLLYHRALLHWVLDDSAAAYADLDMAAAVAPESIELAHQRAWWLYEEGHLDEAVAALDLADEIEPGTTMGTRAKWYLEAKRYEDLLSLDATDIEELRAEALVELGRLPEAADEYAALADRNAGPAAYLRDRVRVLRRLGRFDEVLRLVDAVLAEEGANNEALGLRAWEYLRAGRFTEALEDIDAVSELEPWEDWWFGVRAAVLHGLGRGEEAVVVARKALAMAVETYGEQVDGRDALNRVTYGLLAREEAGEVPEATRIEYEVALDELRVVASVVPVGESLAELESRAR